MTAPDVPARSSGTPPTAEEEIATIASALAQEARGARSPGRSLGALIRWRYRGRGWPDDLCDRLFELGLAELDQQQPQDSVRTEEVSVPPVGGRWLTIEQAADLLQRSPGTIRRRLHTAEGRRDYGWPWWDGHRWLIPSPAVDPAERATYMASLPKDEPYPPPPFAEA